MAAQTGDNAEDQVSVSVDSGDGGDTNTNTTKMDTVALARAAASSSRRTADTPRAPIDEYTGLRQMPKFGMKINSEAVGEGRFHPSPALSPMGVQAIEGYEEHKGYLAQAETVLSAAEIALTEVDNARQKAERNQAWNDYQKLIVVGEFAEKKREQVHKAFNKVHSDLSKAAEMLDQSLSAPLENVTHSALCQEIRAHIKSLPREERGEFVWAAIKRGDMKVLNATLGSPAYLWGGHDAQQQTFLRNYHEAKSPQIVSRLDATRKVIALLERAAPIAFQQFEKVLGNGHTFRKLDQVRAADSEAKKALLMRTNDITT